MLRDTFSAVGPHRASLWVLIALSVLNGFIESILLFLVARLALGTTGDTETVDITFGPLPQTDVSVSTALLLASACQRSMSLAALPRPHATSPSVQPSSPDQAPSNNQLTRPLIC